MDTATNTLRQATRNSVTHQGKMLTAGQMIPPIASVAVAMSLVLAPLAFAQTVLDVPTTPDARTEVSRPVSPTPRQLAYLASPLEQRIDCIEELGEEGAREWARLNGLRPVCGGATKALRQGFDQVWMDNAGQIFVLEAKGGSGQLGFAYGYQQGTAEWAVGAAEATLRSRAATELEREAARLVIRAAMRGDLQVCVIRTTHVLGEPSATLLEGSVLSGASARTLAESAAERLGMEGAQLAKAAQRATNQAIAGETGWSVRSVKAERAGTQAAERVVADSELARTIGKVVMPLAIAADAGFRIADTVDAERQYADGSIDFVDRRMAHARNWGGMAGGWTAGWMAGEFGAEAGALLGTAICPGLGTLIGGGIGGATCGLGGYLAGEGGGGWCAERVAEVAGMPRPDVVMAGVHALEQMAETANTPDAHPSEAPTPDGATMKPAIASTLTDLVPAYRGQAKYEEVIAQQPFGTATTAAYRIARLSSHEPEKVAVATAFVDRAQEAFTKNVLSQDELRLLSYTDVIRKAADCGLPDVVEQLERERLIDEAALEKMANPSLWQRVKWWLNS